MLRRVGSVLIGLGALIGVGVGAAMLAGVHVRGVPWLVAVGLTKLTLMASGGLMAGGAVCLRLDRREAARSLMRGVEADHEPR